MSIAAEPTVLRVLIVEDEPPARRLMHAMLEREADIDVVGECGDGETAVEMISQVEPDVVLLDVQMPELNGFEVIERIGPAEMPAVIFVTAYDAYAVKAFEVHALDYLLKPVGQERLRRALDRARNNLHRDTRSQELRALLESVRARSDVERIAVRADGRIILLAPLEIRYIEAEGAYLRIHLKDRSVLVRGRISAMQERLAHTPLTRVHRSIIVNRDHVRALEPLYGGEFVLWLQDGTRLVTGRTYRQHVRQVFGV